MGSPSVRLGDRHRLLAQPQSGGDRRAAEDGRERRGGRGSRSPGTAVRCGGRAPAPPRGGGGRHPCAATTARRCRSSSAPRHDGRCARARVSADCASSDRIACRAVSRSPRWHASQSRALLSRRSNSRLRSSGTRRGQPLGDGDVGRALVEQAVVEPSGGERQRQLRVRLGASAGKAASSARSVALRPSNTRST